jgi:hypothetical protein
LKRGYGFLSNFLSPHFKYSTYIKCSNKNTIKCNKVGFAL